MPERVTWWALVAEPGAVAPPSARAGPAPVAAPRHWLLTTGWRRHGRLDPREVPGRTPSR